MCIRAHTRVDDPHAVVTAEVESRDAIWLMTTLTSFRTKRSAASIDDESKHNEVDDLARCDLADVVDEDWSRRNVESSARSFPQTAPIVEVRARQIPGSYTPG